MKNCYKCYMEKETEVLDFFDNKFLSFADEYKINRWSIPALIESKILEKCGYFKTIPNNITNISIISPMNLEDVALTGEVKSDYFENTEYYLTPAACLHFYPILSQRKDIRNELITTKARVYRYENGQFENGRRLWDFTVREFVAVGSFEYVNNFLKDFKIKALEFIKKYYENAELKAANDNFYPTNENNMKQRIQKNNQLKFELVWDDLALASFNYHEFHFSKEFGFDNNKTVVTGCVGFGLDRWLEFAGKVGLINELK